MVAFLFAAGIHSRALRAESSALSFSTADIDFGTIIESRCASRKLELTNTGQAQVSTTVLSLEGSDVFRIRRNDRKCPSLLGPGATCRLWIRFCPRWTDHYVARVNVPGGPPVHLSGSGRLRNF
jgi:hypothetical protein